jgi:hypothetical protein
MADLTLVSFKVLLTSSEGKLHTPKSHNAQDTCCKLHALAALPLSYISYCHFCLIVSLYPCCYRQLYCLFHGYFLPLSSLLLDATIVLDVLLSLSCV